MSRLPIIDVCIASCRPEGLRRLLASLAAQSNPGAFEMRIHVADNHPAGGGREVVLQFANEGVPVESLEEPEQNIARARNRSMSTAQGDWIATIDDDLIAEPEWLSRMLEAAVRFEADAVLGPVVKHFPPDTLEIVKESITRPDPPTGATKGFIFATGNSLFRRALIDGNAEPFDPRFGLTGGEDSQFFQQLEQQGCRIVWCSEARVHDEIPADRATLRWAIRRRFQYGNNAPAKLPPRVMIKVLPHLSALSTVAAALMILHLTMAPVRTGSRGRWRLYGGRCLMYASQVGGSLARYAGYRFEPYRRR